MSNFYGNIKVCYNCHFIYEKIDGYRIQVFAIFSHFNPFRKWRDLRTLNSTRNKPKRLLINILRITHFFRLEVSFLKAWTNLLKDEQPKKEVFSTAFYEKLEAFDKGILDLLGLEKKVETLEDFFEMTSAKLRNLSPAPERRSEVSIKSRPSVTPSVRVYI